MSLDQLLGFKDKVAEKLKEPPIKFGIVSRHSHMLFWAWDRLDCGVRVFAPSGFDENNFFGTDRKEHQIPINPEGYPQSLFKDVPGFIFRDEPIIGHTRGEFRFVEVPESEVLAVLRKAVENIGCLYFIRSPFFHATPDYVGSWNLDSGKWIGETAPGYNANLRNIAFDTPNYPGILKLGTTFRTPSRKFVVNPVRTSLRDPSEPLIRSDGRYCAGAGTLEIASDLKFAIERTGVAIEAFLESYQRS